MPDQHQHAPSAPDTRTAPRPAATPAQSDGDASDATGVGPGVDVRSVVVVGAGLAGAQTVAALRAHGFTGTVTLLGAEGVAPYDRPPLSKELLSRPSPVWLDAEMGLDVAALADVRLAAPATRLEVGATGVRVTTPGGLVEADAVVLACGSLPVRPRGWDAAFVLHTADDAARLRPHLTPGARLAVVGAGWVGAEVAGVAAGAGAQVTVVEALDAPLARQLGSEVGAHLAGWYAQAGVALRTGTTVTAVHAGGLDLADGSTVDADAVLVAVGARPATAWLAGSLPLDAAGAVPVDADGRLATAAAAAHGIPGAAAARVWAVGDCARREHPVLGSVPGGHWSAALHDPEPTARALLGLAPEGGTHAPYVFSRQLGHDLALLGLPDPACEVHYRGEPGAGPWAALYLDPAVSADPATSPEPAVSPDPAASPTPDASPDPAVRRLRAVLLVDAPRDVGAARRLFARDARPLVDVARATDPGVRWRDVV
ncbi:NADPH-dependent 2,4-dienoyl-CoA reductase/sulfur reductase-like enzyme [Sediminihabitans luteus]|uniref:NADPH-dependent 2,4-dienoyl-CoA reductase/sulfur reductase-like enzyme n=1 Tax=Sediminihabitans luteus TaxID=1138585 RepID=A0A2M9CYY2_9CELL|nr:FAD-dependent oxidoreductase [Sediminihabitans luteus]PJJ77144.1 NADPH-dependent 2,4-dienoyl-CoA reductase/sulfur reductase-like enzyme [Sediminihabitans luteus]GII98592.1 oxidoreductase [Sediminihabitans luteus]